MGVQFWWFYDVVAVAAILICMFITIKRGFYKAAISAIGYVLAVIIALSLSSSISSSLYKNSIRESIVKKMDQTLEGGNFNEELAKYLESLGYSIRVDREKLKTICDTGVDVDHEIYKYVNNINGRTVDEEAAFNNKLHEGYANIISGFVSKHLNEYSAEYAAEEIKSKPRDFYGFMQLMSETESTRQPAEFIVDNYLREPYTSIVKLITLVVMLAVFLVLTIAISSSVGKNDKMEPSIVTHALSGLIGLFKGAVIVFLIAVIVRINVVFGSNKMLFFNHEAIDKTFIFKYVYNFVKDL
jgi:uncharacterized membrane protein required for colicin V production